MIRLLVADDHPVSRKGLLSLINEGGADFQVVGEASNCNEVLARVSELQPDVVVIDIAMNCGDGVQATQVIRSQFPAVRILVLSRSDSDEEFLKVMKAGAQGYLLKTVGLQTILEAIRLVATGDAVLSPFMTAKILHEFHGARDTGREVTYVLSPREREVLQLAAHGDTNKEIANKCYISETTVKAHFRNILEKLETSNRAGAVALATAKGLIRAVAV